MDAAYVAIIPFTFSAANVANHTRASCLLMPQRPGERKEEEGRGMGKKKQNLHLGVDVYLLALEVSSCGRFVSISSSATVLLLCHRKLRKNDPNK